ncbi:MAG: DNA polymerase III subunit chi [Gammaproteobacteria bacterium]|nr:DNA polymerase III subunit chi [Gammaproteobacteria bacterium]
MTRIDFYLLTSIAPIARLQLVCRLADKAFQQSHRITIHCESAQQSKQLDDLLWTFRDGSFLPHSRYPNNEDPPPPIQVGHETPPDGDADVLINLATTAPAFYTRFARVLEVVDESEANKQSGRARFRYYRDQGHTPNTHKV